MRPLDIAFPYAKVMLMGNGDVMRKCFSEIKRVNRCGNIQVGEGCDIQKCGGHRSIAKKKNIQGVRQEITRH
jgi:hypothetical protein